MHTFSFKISALLSICFLANLHACTKPADISSRSSKPAYAVSGYSVNLREKPGLDQRVLEVLNNGQGIEILDSSKNITEEKDRHFGTLVPISWYKVRTETGNIGYMSSGYIGLSLGSQRQNGMIGVFEQMKAGKLKGTVLSVLQDGVVRTPSDYDPAQSKVISRVPKKMPVEHGFVFSPFQKKLGEVSVAKFSEDYTQDQSPGCWEGYYFSGVYTGGVTPVPGSLLTFGLGETTEPSFFVQDFSEKSLIGTLERLSSSIIRKKNPEEFQRNDFICTGGDKCIYKSIKFNKNEYVISSQTVEYPDKSGHFHVFRIDRRISDKIENLYYIDSMLGKRDVPDKETLLAVTDLDNNGILEIFTFTIGYEWWFYKIYSLEKDRVVPVFMGSGGGC